MRDLLCPDRVLIGGRGTDAGRGAVRALREVYAHWVPGDRVVTTSLCSPELSKLAASALLAQRVSSVNAISALCEATGADVSDVSRAVGRDDRVGDGFLDAGVGFGGPSFQKDVLRLAYACERSGLPEAADYWRQVVAVNEYQKSRLVRRVVSSMFGTPARWPARRWPCWGSRSRRASATRGSRRRSTCAGACWPTGPTSACTTRR